MNTWELWEHYEEQLAKHWDNINKHVSRTGIFLWRFFTTWQQKKGCITRASQKVLNHTIQIHIEKLLVLAYYYLTKLGGAKKT